MFMLVIMQMIIIIVANPLLATIQSNPTLRPEVGVGQSLNMVKFKLAYQSIAFGQTDNSDWTRATELHLLSNQSASL